ncbi:ribose-phosphate diphosphokinase [Natrarchaeobius halalkaliphilus]|uniref:Ribose-phosphate pyrophosphokinase n=1 Tax=Natrarchaeobius halalkaliphilus TaxID=1679091 RepID=A0A3N6MFM2_9EURY|nr:ribose-phosphate diphosphokinase [Natrarchaeobius halalkaliphilus]RQG92706.1 ribose-phosphate diphosphokinase [Natrarchaeobius halalkaliphilus]
MIISGSASQSLAARLATELEESLATAEYDRFPDGELLASVPDIDANAERAVIVASTVSSDAHLEVLQLQDAARQAGIDETVTVLPYMGYGRQDRSFDAGQPISARAVARAISTGTDRVLTVSPHEQVVCEFFEPTATAVEAADRLADPLPADLVDPVFLSPDAGAISLAETVRDAFGAGETDYFEKVRHSGTAVEVSLSGVDVVGRDVVITDDIIATGSTMSEAVAVLRERDVGRVFVTCVHPLLVRNAYTKLARAGVEAIYATDTIERESSVVSVAPELAAHL